MNISSKMYRLLFLLLATKGFAQLFVSPSSYICVNDRYMFVTKAVNISNNANIYLRNGGQFLQGATGSSLNTGTGNLSVFQEGTVNNYAYNYWCSPVGKATAAVTGNEDFGIALLGRPTSVTATTSAVNVGTDDGIASPLTISSTWIYKFISSTNYSQWLYAGNASTIKAGEGFTMKGTGGTDTSFYDNSVANNPGSGQRYDFRGKPNDGDISITVASGQLTLTGNPYPSAINLQNFLTVAQNPSAANCTGIAYFWEQDKTVNSHNLLAYRGGYGAYSAALDFYQKPAFFASDALGNPIIGSYGNGNDYPRKYSPIGQGFMIEGTSSGTTVVMQNKFRVFQKEGATSHFEKNAVENNPSTESALPYIRFNAKLNGEGVRQIALAFHPDATDDVDHGMDASTDASPIDMLFPIGDKDYMIEAVQFDIDKKIPLGFNTAYPAVFQVIASEVVNLDPELPVYLHDKNDNSFHDIKNLPYEFNLPAGKNTERFEITFKNESTLDIKSENENTFEFDAVADPINQQLLVLNPSEKTIASVRFYDISGKLIFVKTNPETRKKLQFSTSGMAEGIYVAKITASDNSVFSKKVTVFQSK